MPPRDVDNACLPGGGERGQLMRAHGADVGRGASFGIRRPLSGQARPPRW